MRIKRQTYICSVVSYISVNFLWFRYDAKHKYKTEVDLQGCSPESKLTNSSCSFYLFLFFDRVDFHEHLCTVTSLLLPLPVGHMWT